MRFWMAAMTVGSMAEIFLSSGGRGIKLFFSGLLPSCGRWVSVCIWLRLVLIINDKEVSRDNHEKNTRKKGEKTQGFLGGLSNVGF